MILENEKFQQDWIHLWTIRSDSFAEMTLWPQERDLFAKFQWKLKISIIIYPAWPTVCTSSSWLNTFLTDIFSVIKTKNQNKLKTSSSNHYLYVVNKIFKANKAHSVIFLWNNIFRERKMLFKSWIQTNYFFYLVYFSL